MNRVLVVDDNQDLCQLLSEILEEAGYNVGIACDGRAALDKIKKERHDVMILDYKLSGISGLTVLKKTRQIRPSLRTIMISAYGNESVRSRAEELGAYDFIDKPFDIDRLVRVVKKALNDKGGVSQ